MYACFTIKLRLYIILLLDNLVRFSICMHAWRSNNGTSCTCKCNLANIIGMPTRRRRRSDHLSYRRRSCLNQRRRKSLRNSSVLYVGIFCQMLSWFHVVELVFVMIVSSSVHILLFHLFYSLFYSMYLM